MTAKNDSFFIGWQSPRGPLRRFLLWLCLVLITLFAGSAFLLSAGQSDPGDGAFRGDWGRQTLTGHLTLHPYPVLHIEANERFPNGDSIMLAGQGKRGAPAHASEWEDRTVTASGIMLKRGELHMLQLRGGQNGLRLADNAGLSTVPPRESLGRWRITGEICDGKCYAGAMRPGRGLAHKACANLCLIGGIPAVFVATDEIEGERFFLMANADGGALGNTALQHSAGLIEVEGSVERLGHLLVLYIDPASIRRAQ